MKLSLRFVALLGALAVANLATAAERDVSSQGFTQTVDCFVQCSSPPPNYYMPDMTIAACCSYVSGDCVGTGYDDGGGLVVCP